MRIPEAQYEEVLAKLDAVWGGHPKCPLCGGQDFAMADRVFELVEHSPDIETRERRVAPVLPVFCLKCGYTMLVNAIVLGIVPAGKPEQQDTETP